ncbi:hypothetical protein KAK07_02930 [Ideonella sp. 4Y16]|uniref:helix-turn-helix transcriptional regulator n=1 Tax=Ideonella alba TaxID=2824118 RepID=UPI001B397ABC|nr:LuxR C-terminal-related transcriptional regulator [Ideonella alba]MBQ0942285.1 hypothetical protein [Ideonella alba]
MNTESLTLTQAVPAMLDGSAPGGVLMNAMINQIGCGLLACDRDGRLLFANRTAQRELEAGRVLALRDQWVRGTDAGHAEFQMALREAADRQRARLLQLGDEGERTMLAVTPIWEPSLNHRVALVMIGQRLPGSALALQMLALRQGLTQTETRVLAALLANQKASEIAQSHGVGLATVRTQIQSVRNKFGVRSIDALLLQVAALPPITTAVH